MSRETPIIPVDNFNLGGLSDSKWSGIKYSVYKMTGFNPHQIPGILRVAQAMQKDSGTTIDEFCKWSVSSTNGRKYWFSSESGKVWMIDTDGTYSLVYTMVPTTGEVKILGAAEYQKFLYIATEQKIARISVDVATSSAEWTANIQPDWATFTIFDRDFHPMKEQNLVLYIGDGNKLAQVDAGTFSPDALDIKNPLRIKSLGKQGTDLLIGTYVSNNVTKTELFRWNTWSGSFQTSNQIDEVGINAFLQTDDFVYVQAGLWGRIYIYDYTNNKLQSFKTVPGDYSPTRYNSCNPDAVGTISGIALFGMSNGLGDPSDEGIFAIGRHSANYPYIMDMPYPLSPRDGSEFALTGLEIGSVLVAGFDVYASWRRTVGAVVTVGVDKLNYSVKLNGAYIESRIMVAQRTELFNVSDFLVAYASLPANCDVQIEYSRNYETYVVADNVPDTMRNIITAPAEGVEATTLQMRLKMVTDGNNAPEIESSGVQLR